MTTKLEKRVQIMLPVRVAVWVEGQRAAFQMACTCDISVHGARLAGVRGVKAVGEVLAVERGKNRAFYRVAWIGKAGSPQHDQIGAQCIEPGKVIWDVNLDELQEQYEPILAGLGDQMQSEEWVEIPAGTTKVHVFGEASGKPIANGELARISHKACLIKATVEAPPRASVQLLITSATFDIRLRGFVQKSDVPAMLSLALNEIRRGDRRALAVLMGKTAAGAAKSSG
jgi:hypothetical protein